MRSGLACILALAFCSAPAFAQRAAGGSTVTGHVYYADTNAPARMATVTLQPASSVDALRAENPKPVASFAQSVQTLLDGSFSIRNAPLRARRPCFKRGRR